MLLHLESRVRDGWVWRSLYGGSEVGRTWKMEGKMGNDSNEEEENTMAEQLRVGKIEG